MDQIWEYFVSGVYSLTDLENNHDASGGPVCASQSTFEFKLVTNLVLLPYELWMLRKGWRILSADFPNRKAALKA